MFGQLNNKKMLLQTFPDGSEGVAWDGVRNYQAANNLRSMK